MRSLIGTECYSGSASADRLQCVGTSATLAGNQSKNDLPPRSWMDRSFWSGEAAETYITNYDLAGLSDDMNTFLKFYYLRRARMGEKLRKMLGVKAPPTDMEAGHEVSA